MIASGCSLRARRPITADRSAIAVLVSALLSISSPGALALADDRPNPFGWPGVAPSGFEWSFPFELRPQAAEGTPGSEYGVSSMRTTVDGWHLKPVYRAQQGWPRVIGFLVWPGEGIFAGESPRALWYERPEEACAEWRSIAFTSGSVWDAVEVLKGRYGIGDSADVFWEVPRNEVEPGLTIETRAFREGLEEQDPLRAFADSLPVGTEISQPSPRSTFLALLQDSGYPAADVPFERKGRAVASAFLWGQARYYERAIAASPLSPGEWSTVLDWAFGSDPGHEHHGQVVNATYGPQVIPMPPDDVLHQPCPAAPGTWDYPAHYEGPWYPVGQVCKCTTIGPAELLSGRLKADARGEIEIHIPFPLPRGTRIRLSVGVGGEIDIKVCLWRRLCTGIAERQTKYRRPPDCQWRWGPTQRTTMPIQFERVFWAFTTPASPCAPELRPTDCPPAEQPCDLWIPTQQVP
jgi:hypothetical protein